ncbi:MAG: hypothetical protein M3Z25_21230 [Actinomycetota bacterium]|nr:hypothetical protein [Pseudonocardiales bacterium]MDQ2709986.1 hypothetical protein [Actinomycetota bacterium]
MTWVLAPHFGTQQPPPNAPEFGGSSPIGLVVILLLFIATFFLIRSMNTHLRKVPESFDPPTSPDPGPEPHSTERDSGTD